MTSMIPAVTLAAAAVIGAPLFALAQDPATPQPIVRTVPDADQREAAHPRPQPPDAPTKVNLPSPEPSTISGPGEPVGRADDTKAAADQRRGGGASARGSSNGSDRNSRARPGGARRGPSGADQRPDHAIGRALNWWRPSRTHLARPYDFDPFWVSGAFGWSPLFYAPWSLMWSTAGYGPYPWFGSAALDAGGLRIKIRPREAQVFVNGFYAGVVDDFDGIFQSLRLAPGGYTIEVRLPGFETLSLGVHIQPGRTTSVQQTMRASNP